MSKNEQKKQKKFKLNYRRVIAIIIILAVIIMAVVVITKKTKKQEEQQPEQQYYTTDGESKYNNSEKLQETKNFEGYEITKIGLNEIEGETYFNAKIKNTSNKSIGNELIYIIFKTKTGQEIYKMQVQIDELEPGKTTNINSKITKDVVGAYDIEITK